MKPVTDILHVVEREWNSPVAAMDLDGLRRVFSELFDECAEAVFSRGLDLDDVIFEKSVVVANGRWSNAFDAERLDEAFKARLTEAMHGDGAQFIAKVLVLIEQNTEIALTLPPDAASNTDCKRQSRPNLQILCEIFHFLIFAVKILRRSRQVDDVVWSWCRPCGTWMVWPTYPRFTSWAEEVSPLRG